MKFLVTMGHHSTGDGGHWHYHTASLTLIDFAQKKILRELTYVSPPESRAMQGHMLFASAQLLPDRRLLATTHTEVLFIDLASWRIERVISLPHFNDLHHALQVDDQIYVCNTGLQAVHRLDLDGKLIDTISANDTPTWQAYDINQDYRPLSTKPHAVHPNHLFQIGRDIWVTRAEQKDAVQLYDHSRRMSIEVGTPHDGNPEGDVVYFTTTNAHIVAVDPASGERRRVIDLNAADTRNRQLGWCRGFRHLPNDHALVGFGQFRRTKFKQFAHWILNDGKAALPSRLALYDLASATLLDEMPFTGTHEGLAIYSIFPWEE